jgi:predicted small integral membrane protein
MIKSVLAGCAAIYALLAGAGNIGDYAANFPYVQHVLTMDTTYQHPSVMWRAINRPFLHHLAFVLIIVAELVVGVLAGAGAARMFVWRHDRARFMAARSLGAAGLLLGAVLWFRGFLVIAGEWFLMWRRQDSTPRNPPLNLRQCFCWSWESFCCPRTLGRLLPPVDGCVQKLPARKRSRCQADSLPA